jgi:uncharacterized protein YjbI with pentapeptide repeats
MSTTIDFAAVLASHRKWLRSEACGAKADLRGADLQCADLRDANLRCANLQYADLWHAYLWHADLWGANLRYADLRYAGLWGANLRGADLRCANLGGADLWHADLRDADLRDANLGGAYLWHADLRGADLRDSKVNWQSHALLSEILLRAAGDSVERRMLSGLIAVSTDWCWDRFLSLEHPERVWAITELAQWVRPDDGAPEVIRAAALAAGGGDA